jgi:plasmid replication initiation protein
LEDLRKLLGLESVDDAQGNTVQEVPLSLWASFRQRALDVALQEINNKTDVKIEVESIQRAKHRRVEAVTFAIEEQRMSKRG